MLTSPVLRAQRASRRERAFATDVNLMLLGILLSVGTTLVAPLPALSAEAAATPDPPGLRVTVAPANRKCFTDMVETVGRIVPREDILIRPEVEGLRISQVLVEDGDRVTEGQVLARLSRPDGQSGPLPAAATVKSPAAGVISYRAAQLQAPATVRGEPLFRLIVKGEVELQAEIPATKLAKLAPGQSATVEIPGRGEVSGHVRTAPGAVDQNTQMASARIFLGDEQVPLGAFAKAVVVVGESCGSSIPLSAIIYTADGPIVRVVRNNQVETRRVKVGLLSGSAAEIRDGLKEGELVVARAGAFLREGDPVRPVATNEESASH
jgi:HlyD family secretion protein